MFRAEIVWAVLLAHGFAAVACPAETVLCRTSGGSVKVETAVNGACSRQLHNLRGSTGGGPTLRPCTGAGRHGPCNDTLLTTGNSAVCLQQLPVPVDDAINVVADPDPSFEMVDVVVVEPIGPPWRQFDLDMLGTVRLLA